MERGASTSFNQRPPDDSGRPICPHCGRDTWDRETLPCLKCPCRNCGGEVDRTRVKWKKDCCRACLKEFEKKRYAAAMRMFNESQKAG